MKKLPKIDFPYWVMIVSANTIGEAGGDLISMTLNLGYLASTILLVSLFAISVVLALTLRRQHVGMYWLVIILSSTAGTTMSDFVTRSLHFGYGRGTLLVLTTMAVVFGVWRLIAPTTKVDQPMTRTVQFLYWSAILTSSTLGTAFGDFLSNGTALGFAGGSALLLGILCTIGLLAMLTPLSRDWLYWLAIIVAHPLGATVGDFLTKDHDDGGMGLGNLKATIILTAIFLSIAGVKFLMNRINPRVVVE